MEFKRCCKNTLYVTEITNVPIQKTRDDDDGFIIFYFKLYSETDGLNSILSIQTN